jgi:hypothetical protein
MRIVVRLFAALVLASIALPVAAQDKVRLLLDWFVNPDHAALVIAKQRGIFAKHGLDVELIAPADPNAPPKLVAAGQAEYAVSYQPTLQMLVAEGLPLVRVGVLVAQPLNSLVVLEDGPVKAIADFKGRKIGYSIAGFEEALLGAILEKAGLTLKDVTLINVNFALTTALMSKQVDGVIGAFRNFELNDLALHKARGRLWEVEKNGVPIDGTYNGYNYTNNYPPVQASLYPSPKPDIPYEVGRTIITNPALAPHEMLYVHQYRALYPPYYYKNKCGLSCLPFVPKHPLCGTEVTVKYKSHMGLFSSFYPPISRVAYSNSSWK